MLRIRRLRAKVAVPPRQETWLGLRQCNGRLISQPLLFTVAAKQDHLQRVQALVGQQQRRETSMLNPYVVTVGACNSL